MMKIGAFLSCLLFTVTFLSGCSSSGQAQMTPEKFKDMVAMLLKLDELKKKENKEQEKSSDKENNS